MFLNSECFFSDDNSAFSGIGKCFFRQMKMLFSISERLLRWFENACKHVGYVKTVLRNWQSVSAGAVSASATGKSVSENFRIRVVLCCFCKEISVFAVRNLRECVIFAR